MRTEQVCAFRTKLESRHVYTPGWPFSGVDPDVVRIFSWFYADRPHRLWFCNFFFCLSLLVFRALWSPREWEAVLAVCLWFHVLRLFRLVQEEGWALVTLPWDLWIIFLTGSKVVIFAMHREETKPYEPQHDKTDEVICAPSENSYQPGRPPSLIRVFAVRLMGS